ncbi:hypothetical protein CLU96_3099 [Chryseobacterium sp. 52]|uniref:hypothetical protein n=1 Tax=Chryseobacterium sp. 52 TaxID=2035213 RepID=UPI000C195567|nr:hypothetical protein [Chryseobacterium sp. 52]PIF46081.1 hypothetical protein CLU96_3099 [Chryseobacterium sp. 52]
MSLNKPFKKIIRPFTNDNYLQANTNTYLLDNDYSNARITSIRAFEIIVKDYLNILDYVEPNDNNENTYSHRIYELFLRTCTEFESNCKSILSSNQFTKTGRWNILDYYKINRATKLSEYEIHLNIWSPNTKVLKPFIAWNSPTPISLDWYIAYNNVKHDRNNAFREANLKNLTLALSGLFTILFSQYYTFCFDSHQNNNSFITDNQGFINTSKSIFKIKLPDTWAETEKYDFDWHTLSTSADKFSSFNFDTP